MAKGGFYRGAIMAWSALAPQLALAEGRLYNDHICFNPLITNENNQMYKPSKWMTKCDLYSRVLEAEVEAVGLVSRFQIDGWDSY